MTPFAFLRSKPFRLRTCLAALGVATAFLSLIPPAPAMAETVVATWNIRNLGWGEKKDYAAVADIASRFDLLAVQEVMSEEGIQNLERAVEEKTGVEWEVLNSHLVGRGRYKEIYSFLFRPDKVSWIDGAVVYTDQRDVFEREPFSAVFQTYDGVTFIMATAHIIYGDDPARRQAEVSALADYRAWLEQSFPGIPVYLSGDFNLPPSDPAWGAVGISSSPLITEGATTLSSRDGKFANLYDNIWAPAGVPLPIADYGVTPFPKLLGISHERARDQVSDHIPVWMILDADSQPVVFDAWHKGPVSASYARPAVVDETSPTALAEVLGNKNSGIYHLPSCPGFAKISEKNRVAFTTEAEAVGAGFRRAGNC